MNHDKAESLGINVRFWDFLFTRRSDSWSIFRRHRRCSSRVLLSDCAKRWRDALADRIGPRLAIGWTMGTLVSALGCYLSVVIDTPTARPSSSRSALS